ncbi:MFS transporter [Nocardioidaceae bacterium]|nr:MFS transporter [Nocardioidaceae bacterium]
MALLDVTIVNIAIPSIRQSLDASPATIQWVVSGYALTFGLTLVMGGRLGDAYGRRRLLLIGLVVFVGASAAAGLATSTGMLIAARLVQGVGSGMLAPQNAGLIQSLFSGAERGKAFGLFGFTAELAAATGPLLGGLLIFALGEADGWRWVFLVNVPIGVLGFAAIWRVVPRRVEPPGDTSLDPVGSLILGVTVLCLMFPVISVEAGLVLPLLLLLGVPVGVWAFVHWERRVKAVGGMPLLDIDLLRRTPGYGDGMTVAALYFTGFTGVILVLSVWLQEGLGATALRAGAALAAFATGAAIAAPLAGRATSRLGRPLTIVALVIIIVGLSGVGLLAPDRLEGWGWVQVGVPLFVAGVGGGCLISPNTTLTLDNVPTEMGGAASGALLTGNRVGGAIGTALLLTVYTTTVSGTAPDTALRLALGVGVATLALALVVAVRAWRHDEAPG